MSVTTVVVTLYIYKTDMNIEKFSEDAPTLGESGESAVNNIRNKWMNNDTTNDTTNDNEQDNNEALSRGKIISDPNMKDNFTKLFANEDRLAFYVSTFQLDKVDLENNYLKNHVKIPTLSDEKNSLRTSYPFKNLFSQTDGLLVDFNSPLSTVYPKDITFNPHEFTIFWYVKFMPIKYSDPNTIQNVFLVNIPIHNVDNIMSVEYIFNETYTNPTIKLHWRNVYNEQSFNNVYEFTNSESDKDKDWNFFDKKYHLFTLIKSKDNKLQLILDDLTLTNLPLISTELPRSLQNGNSTALEDMYNNNYNITLNSNTNDPTNSTVNPVVALNCYMVAFGILNTAILTPKVNVLYEYFQNMRFSLDPRYLELAEKLKKTKDFNDCPFSDKAMCKTTANCASVLNWNDNSQILSNDKCYKDVMKYCKNLDNYDNDKMCTFFDENNILKGASLVNNSSEIKINSEIVSNEEEELMKQLKKIGIDNIYLDKSLRANGKYSKEINELIDKIYEQKQLNVKGLQELYDADSEEISLKQLDYYTLLKQAKAKNSNETSDDSKEDNSDNTKEDTKEDKKEDESTGTRSPGSKSSELIDLKFNDLESYDSVMKNYDDKKNQDQDNNEKKKTGGFLSGWF
jgi:hypothetical protein